MTRTTFLAHRATIVLMAVAVLVATGDGFAQSYAGLYHWALEHGLTGWKAQSFPLLVDLFIAVGELGLFALALEGHRLARRGMAWADLALPFGIASAGWGVSLVFNVGAVGHDFAEQATAAVPPVASMLGLLVLLRTLHRLVAHAPATGTAGLVDVVAGPVDEPLEAAAGGWAKWDTMPVVDQPSQWWPLPALPTGHQDGNVADEAAADGADETDPDQRNGLVVDDDHAGQTSVSGLAAAVKSARESGMSKRKISREFQLSRYRVNRFLGEEEPQVPATVNGHQPQ